MEETIKYPVITIGLEPKSFFDKALQSFRLKPTFYRFEIKPLTLRNKELIAKEVISMPEEMLRDGLQNSILNLFSEHIDSLIRIIGIGLVNNISGPSDELLKRIKDEFTVDDLDKAMRVIVGQVNIPGFVSCLIFIYGQSILTPPKTEVNQEADDSNLK